MSSFLRSHQDRLLIKLLKAWEGMSSSQKAELIRVAPECYFATARVVRCYQIAAEETA